MTTMSGKHTAVFMLQAVLVMTDERERLMRRGMQPDSVGRSPVCCAGWVRMRRPISSTLSPESFRE